MDNEKKDELRRARNRARKLRFKLRHPEKFKAQKAKHDATYRATHKEQKRQRDAEYSAKNREQILLKHKEYYRKNKERMNAYGREQYQKNRTEVLASRKIYREANVEKVRAAINAWRMAHPERCRELSAKKESTRRARKRGVKTEPYDRRWVFERDQGVCYLCNVSIDYYLLFPDEMSFSIDHIVPISRGGNDVLSNVASTHLGCNRKKHVKLLTRSTLTVNI